MSGERFTFDSNILVYALDRDAGDRHRIASRLMAQAHEMDCMLTLQALAEFFFVVTRKAGMPVEDARAQIDDWRALFPVRPADPDTLTRAIAAVRDHRLAFWDAMLWACAKDGGCGLLVSEDFQHGRTLNGVRFHNPFVEPFAGGEN
jgi:predicted nucleic acid-binding protein